MVLSIVWFAFSWCKSTSCEILHVEKDVDVKFSCGTVRLTPAMYFAPYSLYAETRRNHFAIFCIQHQPNSSEQETSNIHLQAAFKFYASLKKTKMHLWSGRRRAGSRCRYGSSWKMTIITPFEIQHCPGCQYPCIGTSSLHVPHSEDMMLDMLPSKLVSRAMSALIFYPRHDSN